MKLKICGIHDKDILQHACEAGVDFVGFIMANESPRKISDNFLASLENFNFLSSSPVFVFVNPSVEEVTKITACIENPILQFHGDEEDSFCQQFNQSFWKTIRVKDSQSLIKIDDFLKKSLKFTISFFFIDLMKWYINLSAEINITLFWL